MPAWERFDPCKEKGGASGSECDKDNLKTSCENIMLSHIPVRSIGLKCKAGLARRARVRYILNFCWTWFFAHLLFRLRFL